MSLFMSLVGMVVLIAIAVLLSDNRKAINIRTVGGAFAIQFFTRCIRSLCTLGSRSSSRFLCWCCKRDRLR